MNIRISGITPDLLFHVCDPLLHHLHLLPEAFLVVSQVVHVLFQPSIQRFVVRDCLINIFLELVEVVGEDSFDVLQVPFYLFVRVAIFSYNFLNSTINTSKVLRLEAISSFMTPYYF